MVTSQSEVWPRAMSESMALVQLGFVVMSLVYVTIGAMGDLAWWPDHLRADPFPW